MGEQRFGATGSPLRSGVAALGEWAVAGQMIIALTRQADQLLAGRVGPVEANGLDFMVPDGNPRTVPDGECADRTPISERRQAGSQQDISAAGRSISNGDMDGNLTPHGPGVASAAAEVPRGRVGSIWNCSLPVAPTDGLSK